MSGEVTAQTNKPSTARCSECQGPLLPIKTPVHTAKQTVMQVTGYRCPTCGKVFGR